MIEIVAPVIKTLHTYVDQGGRSGIDQLMTSAKFEIVVADGRHTMALDATRYDVIEADAILPKDRALGLALFPGILPAGPFEAGTRRNFGPVGTDETLDRYLPLCLPLRHHSPSAR